MTRSYVARYQQIKETFDNNVMKIYVIKVNGKKRLNIFLKIGMKIHHIHIILNKYFRDRALKTTIYEGRSDL